MNPRKNSEHDINITPIVSQPRSRSRLRKRNGQASKETLLPSLKPKGKTVTFVELVETQSQSSPEQTEPDRTAVIFSSHEPNDTVDNGLANHFEFIEEHSHGHSLHLPHLLHHKDYSTKLANDLSFAIRNTVQDPSHKHNTRGFISTEQLCRILEKRTIEKVLESFIPKTEPHTEPHTENHRLRKYLSILRPRFSTLDDVGPRLSPIHHDRSYIPDRADYICNKLRKIFATLLLIKKPIAIIDFIGAGLTDDHLPLQSISFNTEDGKGPVDVLCSRDRLEHSPPNPCSSCRRHCSLALANLFEDRQWEMLAPVFEVEEDGKSNHYILHDRVILPFTYCRHACRGSRGEILKVKIHADHHNFHNFETSPDSGSFFSSTAGKDTPFFAVKKLAGGEDFGQERSVLKRIDDQHVITLLATYEHRGYHHLVMPWAECNLEDFWSEKMPDPPRDSQILHWMARQCLGVAKGLSKVQHHLTNSVSSLHGSSLPIPQRSTRAPGLSTPVSTPSVTFSASKKFRVPSHALHKFFGRHGDIKPQNLLWFPGTTDLGIVKISDFGEGEFNKSQSAHRSTDSISYTPSYRPPECDDPAGEVEIHSATFDTWSLGCLYLEFITWYIGGWQFVLEFERSRHGSPGANHPSNRRRPTPFFETTGPAPPEPHARIKPAVTQVCPHLLKPQSNILQLAT